MVKRAYKICNLEQLVIYWPDFTDFNIRKQAVEQDIKDTLQGFLPIVIVYDDLVKGMPVFGVSLKLCLDGFCQLCFQYIRILTFGFTDLFLRSSISMFR